MTKLTLKYCWFAVVLIIVSVSSVSGQINIDGSLGVDFHVIGATTGSNNNQFGDISSNRLITNHYLNLGRKGFIKNDKFMTYSLFSKFNGFYNTTSSATANESFYKSPALRTFTGDLMIFPSRPYSLQLYYLSFKDVGIVYNKNNRSKTDIITPGLASIQKNRLENEKYGLDFKSKITRDSKIEAFYQESTTKTLYDFDFQEDKNISVTTQDQVGDLFNPNVVVVFTNDIDDDSVRVVSGLINQIIPPGFTVTIEFDPGTHTIDFIPLHKYNQSRINVNLEQGRFYRVLVEIADFPSLSDNYKDTKDAEIEFNYNKRKMNIKTTYNRKDQVDKIYGKTELENKYKNVLGYMIRRNINLSVQTELQKRDDTQSGRSKLSDLFKNNTILDYQSMGGFNASFTNNYSNSDITNEDSTQDKSIDKVYELRLAKLSQRLNHNISAKGTYTTQDKSGQKNDYTTEKGLDVSNRMEFNLGHFLVTPLNTIRLISKEKTDSTVQTGSDVNINTSIETFRSGIKYIGDMTNSVKHTYTSQKDDEKKKSNTTYELGTSLTREFSEDYSLKLSTTLIWKSFGEEILDYTNIDTANYAGARPSEFSSMYGITLNSSPWDDVDLNTVLSFNNTPGNKTVNFALTLKAYIPYIKVPFVTDITRQKRNLEGLPTQTMFEEETVIQYTINQMKFELNHYYTKEKLVLDTYSYYEFSFKIARLFKL